MTLLLLFQKPIDYKDESEFRIATLNPEINFFDYKDALKYIILGIHTTNENLHTLISIDKYRSSSLPILKYEINQDATPFQSLNKIYPYNNTI